MTTSIANRHYSIALLEEALDELIGGNKQILITKLPKGGPKVYSYSLLGA